MTDLEKRLEELASLYEGMAKNRFAIPDEKRLARVFSDKLRGVLAERKASSPVVDAEAVRDRIAGYMASLDHVDWGIAKQIAAGKLYLDRADEVLALLSPTQEAKP